MTERDEKNSSSSKFDDIFDANYAIPWTRIHRIEEDKSSKGLGTTSALTAIMQKIDKLEEELDRVEERLDKVEHSYSKIHASISNMNAVIECLVARTGQKQR